MNTYIFEYMKKGHIFSTTNRAEIYARRIEQAVDEFEDLFTFDRITNIYRVDCSYDEYVEKMNDKKLNE